MLIKTHSKRISPFLLTATLAVTMLAQAILAPAAWSSTLRAPTIYPNGGTFISSRSVTIGNIPSGDTAYYTTDGTNPTTSSTAVAYSGAFTVDQSETVKAANYNDTTGWSSVASATFYINNVSTLQTPTIYPNGGTFISSRSVTIGNIPSGDTAYYTTDGTNPTTSSTAVAYSGAFTVDQSATVKAANYNDTTGWSSVASATFYINNSSGSGDNSDQIAQLKQEFNDAVNNNQMDQATQILQQIEQLANQNQAGDLLSNLKTELTDAVNNNGWAKAETILKQIIKLQQPSWAFTQLGQIYQQQGNNAVSVFTNGDQLNCDVQPVITNGRTLIPIRSVANALGISDNDVSWSSSGTVTIKNGSNQITLRNNDQHVYLNGKSYSSDAASQIINGRMMVPIRAVGQLLNRNVQWYPNGKIVSIS